jgi:hypothetical protein
MGSARMGVVQRAGSYRRGFASQVVRKRAVAAPPWRFADIFVTKRIDESQEFLTFGTGDKLAAGGQIE